jgi:hypothetical protein
MDENNDGCTVALTQPSKFVATLKQAEDVELYLEYARQNGQDLGIISKAYIARLDQVLKHLKVRIARGTWK